MYSRDLHLSQTIVMCHDSALGISPNTPSRPDAQEHQVDSGVYIKRIAAQLLPELGMS